MTKTKINPNFEPQIVEDHLKMLFGPGVNSEHRLGFLLEWADDLDDDEFMAVFASA